MKIISDYQAYKIVKFFITLRYKIHEFWLLI